jgi:hypothetical protein
VEVKAEVKSSIHGKRKATVNTASSSKSNKKAKKITSCRIHQGKGAT